MVYTLVALIPQFTADNLTIGNKGKEIEGRIQSSLFLNVHSFDQGGVLHGFIESWCETGDLYPCFGRRWEPVDHLRMLPHSVKSEDSKTSSGTVLHVTSFDSIFRDAKELKRIEDPILPSHESVSGPILLPKDLPLSDASECNWDARHTQEQWSKRMTRMRDLFNRNRRGVRS